MDYKDGCFMGPKIIAESLEDTTDKIIYYISKTDISYDNFNNFYRYIKFLKKSEFIEKEKLKKLIKALIENKVIINNALEYQKYLKKLEKLKEMLGKKKSLKKHH